MTARDHHEAYHHNDAKAGGAELSPSCMHQGPIEVSNWFILKVRKWGADSVEPVSRMRWRGK